MKILIDVNLAVRWADMLSNHGIESIHWTTVGRANAKDTEIMTYARENGYSIFTNDLDFSTVLVNTQTSKPSVIQIRAEDTRPEANLIRVVDVFKNFKSSIEQGALITINANKTRLNILPFKLPDL